MYGTEYAWKGPKPWIKNEEPRRIDIHREKLNARAAKLAHKALENTMKRRQKQRVHDGRARDFRREQTERTQRVCTSIPGEGGGSQLWENPRADRRDKEPGPLYSKEMRERRRQAEELFRQRLIAKKSARMSTCRR